jgi:hypothetical protein
MNDEMNDDWTENYRYLFRPFSYLERIMSPCHPATLSPCHPVTLSRKVQQTRDDLVQIAHQLFITRQG